MINEVHAAPELLNAAQEIPRGMHDHIGKPIDLTRTTRIDAHCHSWASDGPVNKAIGLIGVPECYSPPERVYEQAMTRGMDLFTLTDHDSIQGALSLVERGFDRVIIGQEVSVRFPEDGCLLHVLVWGLTPELDEQLNRDKLRNDVYAFAAWLREHNLAHALAHPLYIQNGRLSRWHIERCALLFKGFETLNGAHSVTMSDVLIRYLDRLTPGLVHRLVDHHGIEPLWPRIWEKAKTGGSDDHALLNIGRTWTGITRPETTDKITDPLAFFRQAMTGECFSGGIGGHSALLAHQLATVGANYYAAEMFEDRSPTGRYVSSKLLRFAGVDKKKPSKFHVAAYKATMRFWKPRKSKSLPLVHALRTELGGVLDQYPDLRERLDKGRWMDGAPVSQHEEMMDFAQDLIHALSRAMGPGVVKGMRKRDGSRITEHLLSYAILHVAQLPYLISLFHQNKERNFVERFEHETSEPSSGMSVLERPMRVSLFTDTIADINGVCRFIQNVAEQAHETGRDLEVITSTKLECPDMPNIYNFDPVFATKMPKYDNLDMVLPPLMKILRHVDTHQPDVIHISTPGPVGCIGFLAAKMLRVPVLGVYHTDFPAYIDQLFDDSGFTKLTETFMRGFYKPFSAIFTRSEDYINALDRLGMDRSKIVNLLPGFDANQFHTNFADHSIWSKLDVKPDTVKALYVGRVSVEKNLPFLTKVWKRVQERCETMGISAELVVVGDGPYREKMNKVLGGKGVTFLGFRHGEELSTIYASSDLFIFPSVTDTLGQVVMESQGSGLPVIVTDVGGPKEVVEHERTGYVLDSEDTSLWIERIVGLLADEAKRRRMGAAAHAAMQKYALVHSFEHFWEVHTEAWHAHLAKIGVTDETRGSRAVEPSAANQTNGETSDNATGTTS